MVDAVGVVVIFRVEIERSGSMVVQIWSKKLSE